MMHIRTLLLVVPWLLVSPAAVAVTLEISADFKPGHDGARHAFVDTTPASGFCTTLAAQCRSAGMASIDTRVTGVSRRAAETSADALVQREFALTLPGLQRRVRVTNGRDTYELKFRIAAHALALSGAGRDLVDDGLHSPEGGCRSMQAGNPYVWTTPAATTRCHARLAPSAPDELHYTTSLGYELIFPDAAKMPAGVYRGELRYGIGAGQDFDYLGDTTTNDTEVVFRFTLNVEHALRVDFGHGRSGAPIMATLEPRGGWQAWRGRSAPEELVNELPFRLSLSGPTRIHMTCGSQLGTACSMRSTRDPSMATALAVAMSIPGAHVMGDGRAVERMAVPVGATAATTVGPHTGMLQAQPSLLHVSTGGNLEPGTTYAGDITLVFDAD
jgi:hypothetical protein